MIKLRKCREGKHNFVFDFKTDILTGYSGTKYYTINDKCTKCNYSYTKERVEVR